MGRFLRRLGSVGMLVLALIASVMAGISLLDRPLRVADFPERMDSLRLPPASPPADLRFSVFVTSRAEGAPEPLIVAGGDWRRQRRPVHTAVLIEHPQGTFLYDTGLSRQVHADFARNRPRDRLMFRFGAVNPVREQMAHAGYPAGKVQWIVLSHLHWDHAAGLTDFLQLPVWVPEREREAARAGKPPAYLADQFKGVATWRPVVFAPAPYLSFAESLDVFSDGSVVLVPLEGHSAGQVGMFLTLADGQRYFFSADVTWTAEGITLPADRSWLLRQLVHIDHDETGNQAQIVRLHRLQKAQPDLLIVPAHDEHVLRRLPIFPHFRKSGSENNSS